MRERNISWAEVLAVAGKPDKVAPGHSNAVNYYRVVGRRRLRITVDRNGFIRTVAIAEGSK
jgi:hypothetical protein